MMADIENPPVFEDTEAGYDSKLSSKCRVVNRSVG